MLVQGQPNYSTYCNQASFCGIKPNKAIKDAEKVIKNATEHVSSETAPYNNAYAQSSIHYSNQARNVASRASEAATVTAPSVKGLKKYITHCDSRDYDPAKIEKLLLKAGAVDVTERDSVKFVTDKFSCPNGKKKTFELNGQKLTLEAHDVYGKDSNNIEVRLYTEGPKKSRYYLTRNGIFEQGYGASTSHLTSDYKALDWMRKG